MQLTFQDIVSIVIQRSGKAINGFNAVTMDLQELLSINNPEAEGEIWFGTFSGMFGEQDSIVTNCVGVSPSYVMGFKGTDETNTAMGMCAMTFPNVMFTYIGASNAVVPNNQILFSGYHFFVTPVI